MYLWNVYKNLLILFLVRKSGLLVARKWTRLIFFFYICFVFSVLYTCIFMHYQSKIKNTWTKKWFFYLFISFLVKQEFVMYSFSFVFYFFLFLWSLIFFFQVRICDFSNFQQILLRAVLAIVIFVLCRLLLILNLAKRLLKLLLD